MATTINADDGAVSGSAGLKYSSDSTGVLALQTNGTTAVSVSTAQVVTLTNALPVASGGTGAITNAGAPFALKGANSDITALSGLTTPLSVGQGGTGLATATGVLIGAGSSVSAVAAGTNGNLLTSNGTTWVSQAAAASGATGDNTITVGTSPGTWTKPASVKSIKVTVVGGGGNAGSYGPAGGDSAGGGGGGAAIRFYPAPSLPGPQPYTVGAAGSGTSSFGVAPVTVISATGGAIGQQTPGPAPAVGGAGGAGSNGSLNVTGGRGQNYTPVQYNGNGGSSILGFGGVSPNVTQQKGTDATGYGGGGGGGRFSTGPATVPGALGTAGVVIIEEFY